MTPTPTTPIQTALNLLDAITGTANSFTGAEIADARKALATLPEFEQELLQTDPDTESLSVYCYDFGVSVSKLLDWQEHALYAFAAELHRLGVIGEVEMIARTRHEADEDTRGYPGH